MWDILFEDCVSSSINYVQKWCWCTKTEWNIQWVSDHIIPTWKVLSTFIFWYHDSSNHAFDKEGATMWPYFI